MSDKTTIWGQLQQVALTSWFAYVTTAVILLNALCMLIQADGRKECQQTKDCTFKWQMINFCFLGFFVVELLFRFIAFGCRGFFCNGPEVSWNWFDFTIVCLGLVDAVCYFFSVEGAQSSRKFVKVIRVCRLLRVLRIIRLFKTFPKLRLLIRGLLESISDIKWIAVLLMIIIYIFAITFTYMIGHEAKDGDWGEDSEELILYFGSVGRSMFTLFQMMTMDDWNSLDNTIVSEPGKGYLQFFIFIYIIFVSFVMVSAWTGVMTDHMAEVRQQDEDEERRRTQEDMSCALPLLLATFQASDQSKDNSIDFKEFVSMMANPEIHKELGKAGIKLTGLDAREMFEFFDLDASGQLGWKEFTTGMQDIRRGLTRKQLLKLQHSFKNATAKVEQQQGSLSTLQSHPPSEEAQQHLVEVRNRLTRLEERLVKFETSIRTFMDKFREKKK